MDDQSKYDQYAYQKKCDKQYTDKGLKRMMVWAPEDKSLRKKIRNKVSELVNEHFEKEGKE